MVANDKGENLGAMSYEMLKSTIDELLKE